MNFHYPPKIKNTSLALSWRCRNANARGPTTNHNITAASERAAKIGGEYLRNVMQQCSEGASNRVTINGRIINSLPKFALYHSLSSSIVDNELIKRSAETPNSTFMLTKTVQLIKLPTKETARNANLQRNRTHHHSKQSGWRHRSN